MARIQTISVRKKNSLSNSIKRLTNKINQINDFLPVYKEELIQKRNDKLQTLLEKQSKILLPYEINSLGYDYFLKLKEAELNLLKEQHYWRLREIDNKFNTKMQYKKDLETSIEFLSSFPNLISLLKENLTKKKEYEPFLAPYDYLKLGLLKSQNVLLKQLIGFLDKSNKNIKSLRHKRSRSKSGKVNEITHLLQNELEIVRHLEYLAYQVSKLENVKAKSEPVVLSNEKYQKLNKLIDKLQNTANNLLEKDKEELTKQEDDQVIKNINLDELKIEIENYKAKINEIEAKYTKEEYEKFILSNNLTKVESNKQEDIINSSKLEYEKLTKQFELEAKELEKKLIDQNKVLYAKKEKSSSDKVKTLKEKLKSKTDLIAKYNEAVLNNLQIDLTELKKSYSNEADAFKRIEIQEEINKIEGLIEMYSPKDNSVLKISNLHMQFGGLKVIKNLSFDIKRGEIFGLIGPNGAGKTTVFNCVTQFYKPTSGEIRFKNSQGEIINLLNLQVHDVIDYGIVRTFQNIELITELTILENLLVGAHKSYRSSLFSQMFHTKSLKEEEKVTRAKALKILEEFGLSEYKDNYPVGLPYGVLKRIEFARTLMLNPELIILDEPAAGLNEVETIELTEFIKEVKDKYNVTIFLVEHDMGLVMNVSDRICAISFGEHLITGTPDEVKNDKKVQEAYLGGE